jgi:hypothetical protein
VFASMDNALVPGDVYDIDGTVTNGLGQWYDTFVDEATACTAPSNQVPLADDGVATTDEDTAVDLTLQAVDTDGDELTFSIVDGPSNGTLGGTGATYRYTPAANWHGTDTVTFIASDGIATSAVATVTITVVPVNDAPTVSIVSPTPDTRVAVGAAVTLDTTVADPADAGGTITCAVTWGDGTGGSSCDDLHAFAAAGSYTITVQASDGDGGTASATTTVVVDAPASQCTFGGFSQPVDSAPTVNTVKAGANVPLKFTYCADGRLAIFAAGSPASAAHVCGAAPTDALEETGQPGASTLTFDPVTGRYHYNWKTEKGWKGQCRTLVFTFVDGTSVTAEFKFT